ncbi:MAG TPA: hypothetical protein PKC80_07125 [Burkholderiaceae bacterium]|nr:hypothetical protein [Burkholderiaceae bacterium]
MKLSQKRGLIALTLLLISTGSWTASLGTHANTSIVFDRKLDVTIPAQLDTPPEDVTSCFVAETYQGGNRFDMNRLQIDVKPTEQPLNYVVRIRSTTSVTEPWAKLVVHTTCGPKISRSYEFLTELSPNPSSKSTETNGAVIAVGIKETESVKRDLSQRPDVQTNKQTTSLLTAVSASPGKQSVRAESVHVAKSARQITSKKVPLQGSLKSDKKLQTNTANANGAPRLILENAPLLSENQIMLKLTTDLLATSKSSDVETPEHAQSMAQARAIWHTLNAKKEDLAADAMKLQNASVQLAEQNKTNLDLSAKLRVAEQQRTDSNALVYALGAMLALAMLAVAWLWMKNRQVSRAGYAWLNEANLGMPPLPLTPETDVRIQNQPEEEFAATAPLDIKKPKIAVKTPKPRAEKSPPTATKPRKPRATSKKKTPTTNSSETSVAGANNSNDSNVSIERNPQPVENTTRTEPVTPAVPPRTDPIDVDLLFKKSPLYNPKAEKQAEVLLREAQAQVDSSSKTVATSSKNNLIDFESFTLPPTRKKT